jgi:hypothetical protein
MFVPTVVASALLVLVLVLPACGRLKHTAGQVDLSATVGNPENRSS